VDKVMKYIMVISEEQSFSKAALKLFITQPALSTIIKKEELKYGAQFFYRGVKPIILTEAGAKYIQAAKKMQKIEEALYRAIKSSGTNNVGTITIGSSAFFCSNMLPSIISEFKKEMPCDIKTIEQNTEDLNISLQNGSIDFLIGVDDITERKSKKIFLKDEHVIAAVPKLLINDDELLKYALPTNDIVSGHYLFSNQPPIDFKYFNNLPFVLLAKGNETYYMAKKIFQKYKIYPSEIIYMSQMQSSYFFAINDKKIVFIRAALLKYIEPSSKMLYFKIDDSLSTRGIYIFYKKKKRLTPLMQAFVSYCQNHF